MILGILRELGSATPLFCVRSKTSRFYEKSPIFDIHPNATLLPENESNNMHAFI